MTLPRDVGEVGWLTRSAGAGDVIGTTVIGGHVSDRHDRPGALHDLDRARVGQVITIRQGRTTHRFAVTRTHLYRRGARLPQGYFATTGRHRLVLVSCTDRVVHPDGRFHYTRTLVVEARLLT
ncbi:MAG: class F sortase [Nocardioides sp.]